MSTKTPLTYKNFKAELRFDQDDEFIVVKVIGVPKLFHARSKKAAEEEFHRLVDQQLLGKMGNAEQILLEKSYSGNIALRVGSSLHQELGLAAHRSGRSLNSYIEEKLQIAIDKEALGPEDMPFPREKAIPKAVYKLLEDQEASAQLFSEIQDCLQDKINIFQFPEVLKKFLMSFGESLDEISPFIKPEKLGEFNSSIALLIRKFSAESNGA
jgi:predicted HicB family RNase H-like nuclease